MAAESIFPGMGVSASGLRAERYRLEVIAQNIANAHTTKGPGGQPYRRQVVQFEAALEGALAERDGAPPRGVTVSGVVDDPTPFNEVFQPGHPDANEAGYVLMPNVNLPFEMVDMATSTRSYEANLAALKAFRRMGESALGIGGPS
ncbi:MAG: flagellar basal body rod protein FlgC [Planctomycetes bacterium]|nr:flagellar basal body rod protein FlgC [Planctomycetota bacterium]